MKSSMPPTFPSSFAVFFRNKFPKNPISVKFSAKIHKSLELGKSSCDFVTRRGHGIEKQQQKVEAMRKLETKKLPLDIDYSTINELRLEAREKLNVVRPINLGQALRISGVNPADVAVLSIWLKQRGETKDK